MRTKARLPRRSPDSRAVPAGRGQQLGGRSQPRARAVARLWLPRTRLLSVGRGTPLLTARPDPAAQANLGLGCENEVCGARCGGPRAPAQGRRAEGAPPWPPGGKERRSLEGPRARGCEGISASLQLRPGLVPPTPRAPLSPASGATTRPRPRPRCASRRRRPGQSPRSPGQVRAPPSRRAACAWACAWAGAGSRVPGGGGGGGADALDRGRERQAAGCM